VNTSDRFECEIQNAELSFHTLPQLFYFDKRTSKDETEDDNAIR